MIFHKAQEYPLTLMMALVSLLTIDCRKIHSGTYKECFRGRCEWLNDRAVGWEFDQPEPFYVERHAEGDIRKQLEEYRMGVSFKSEGFEETVLTIPSLIHLIWIGSPLPSRYLGGPLSFAEFNPDHTVQLWVDQTPLNIEEKHNLKILNINQEEWINEDLLEECTNYAMKSDILRLEIVYRYGGIYVDVDATALRSFGPVFSRSFLSFRPANWTLSSRVFSKIQPKEYHIGSAGFDNNAFGFPAKSNFLLYALAALRENFPTQTATLHKTGPFFLKEVFLQYPFSHRIPLISWEYTGSVSEFGILVDLPGNADWDDGQDVRKIHHEL